MGWRRRRRQPRRRWCWYADMLICFCCCCCWWWWWWWQPRLLPCFRHYCGSWFHLSSAWLFFALMGIETFHLWRFMLSKTESLELLAHRVWNSYPGTRTRLFEDGPTFTGRFHGMSPTLGYPFSFSSIFASHCQIGWSYDSNSQCFNFHFCLPGETLILFDLFGWFESSWFFFPVNAPPISIPIPMGYHRNMDGSSHPLLPKFGEKHPVTSHDLGHHPGPAEVKALRAEPQAEPQAEPWWEAWWFRSSKPVQGSVREAGMSRMSSKGSFFTLGGLEVEVVFASRRAAVRNCPPPIV